MTEMVLASTETLGWKSGKKKKMAPHTALQSLEKFTPDPNLVNKYRSYMTWVLSKLLPLCCVLE